MSNYVMSTVLFTLTGLLNSRQLLLLRDSKMTAANSGRMTDQEIEQVNK